MKPKHVIRLCVGICLMSTIVIFAFKNSRHKNYSINFVPAKTSNELVAIRNNPHANVVRDLKQFDEIIASNETPLNTLPKEVVDEFRREMVVREGVGIVGLRYGTIKKLLSDEDFSTVMAMFGIDTKNGYWGFSKDENVLKSIRGKHVKALFEDYKEYRCESAHTCSSSADHICLSGC